MQPSGMRDIQITDKESLETFLDEVEEPRRRQAAVFIAARAALRVAPLAHDIFDVYRNKKPLTPLPVLRPLLISSVSAKTPTDEIRPLSNAFVEATAESAAIADAGAAAGVASVAAARAADAAAYAIAWRATHRDADLWVKHADAETGNLSIDIAPLWDGAHPLDADWQTLQDRMRTDPGGADWSFWINWY